MNRFPIRRIVRGKSADPVRKGRAYERLPVKQIVKHKKDKFKAFCMSGQA